MKYAIVAFAVLAFILWLRSEAKKQEKQSQFFIRKWISEVLQERLAHKCNIKQEQVHDVLMGQGNSSIEKQIEKYISKIELVYTLNSPSIISCKLHVQFDESEHISSTIKIERDEAPDKVRESFLRSNEDTICFAYKFPWQK